MEYLTEEERSQYQGFWFPYSLELTIRSIKVGDMVMYETMEGVEIARVHKIRKIDAMMDIPHSIAEYLWDNNGHIIPRRQVIAFKPERVFTTEEDTNESV